MTTKVKVKLTDEQAAFVKEEAALAKKISITNPDYLELCIAYLAAVAECRSVYLESLAECAAEMEAEKATTTKNVASTTRNHLH